MQDHTTGKRGQTLIPFAMLIGGVLAFMGLIFDGGRLYYEKARMQAAADAGALAGSWEQQRRNTANVDAAAKQSTKLNGFEHGVDGVDVQVTPGAGNTTVTVVVEQDFPTSFLRVLGLTQSLVRARAVAGLRAYGDACVLALDRSASGAITTNGGPTLVATCGIMSNSDHSTRGLRATGGSIVSATWVGVSGGADGEEHFTPPPEEDVPTMLDPLATWLRRTIPLGRPALTTQLPRRIRAPEGPVSTPIRSRLPTDRIPSSLVSTFCTRE